jgi:hypothetical protein
VSNFAVFGLVNVNYNNEEVFVTGYILDGPWACCQCPAGGFS